MYRITYKNALGKTEDYGADFSSVREALITAANNGVILDSLGMAVVEKKHKQDKKDGGQALPELPRIE
jgi:hypothetical protein